MMRRFAVSGGLVLVAALLLVIGILVHDQSAFATGSVQTQLAAQGITFTPVSGLTAQQKTHACLITNAGKPLITGAQAACYANYQIALDLLQVDGGKTYAEASYPVRQLAETIAYMEYKQPNNPKLPALQAKYAKLDGPADTLFQGEALRGMLLTTYAFSHMGDLGDDTADVLFVLSGLTLLAALALLAVRPRSKVSAPVDN